MSSKRLISPVGVCASKTYFTVKILILPDFGKLEGKKPQPHQPKSVSQ